MARTRALTPSRIEAIIKAGQNRGLTATSVSQYPDGRTVVEFGDNHGPKKHNALEWDI